MSARDVYPIGDHRMLWPHYEAMADAIDRLQANEPTIVSVGVDYCLLHMGLRNEDEDECDNARWDEQETPCQLRPLFYALDTFGKPSLQESTPDRSGR